MSIAYDLYLEDHKKNVKNGFDWIELNLPDLLKGIPEGADIEQQIVFGHDASKTDPEEYDAYDAYFYGSGRSYAVVAAFNVAWLAHIHKNPHHWQYWVLNNDDPDMGQVFLDIPYNYIIEMICDWWSFSYYNGDLSLIFSWYKEHKDYIKLNGYSRVIIERILQRMYVKLTMDGIINEK